MTDDDVARVARRVVQDLLSGPHVPDMLREACLLVHLQNERQRERGAIKTFLDVCRARGVRVTLRPDGTLACSDRAKLGNDLWALSVQYREAIVAHLEQLRLLEQARQRQVGPDTLPLRGFVNP